jgi:hypothetical protein
MERLVVQAAYKQKLEEVRGRGRGISSVSSLGEVTEQQVPIVVSAPCAFPPPATTPLFPFLTSLYF